MKNTENNTANKPDPQMVEYYHDMEWMPDKAYYQLNGESVMENYMAQKQKSQADWRKDLLGEGDYTNLHITSEVKIKK